LGAAYRYAENSPVNFTDPSGLDACYYSCNDWECTGHCECHGSCDSCPDCIDFGWPPEYGQGGGGCDTGTHGDDIVVNCSHGISRFHNCCGIAAAVKAFYDKGGNTLQIPGLDPKDAIKVPIQGLGIAFYAAYYHGYYTGNPSQQISALALHALTDFLIDQPVDSDGNIDSLLNPFYHPGRSPDSGCLSTCVWTPGIHSGGWPIDISFEPFHTPRIDETPKPRESTP
jgi:hypothetical protein